jgi:hypothetical protein
MRERCITQLPLPDDLDAAVRSESARLGVSRGEYARQGIVLRLAWSSALAADRQGDDPETLLADALGQLPLAVHRLGQAADARVGATSAAGISQPSAPALKCYT